MYVSFCGFWWEILGRMIEAREDAAVDDVPGDECSVRMVVLLAIQALEFE